MEYCRAHDFHYNDECPYCAEIVEEINNKQPDMATKKQKYPPNYKEIKRPEHIRAFRNDNGEGDTMFYLIPDGHPDMPTFHIVQEDAYGGAEFFSHQTVKQVEERYQISLQSPVGPLHKSISIRIKFQTKGGEQSVNTNDIQSNGVSLEFLDGNGKPHKIFLSDVIFIKGKGVE